MVSFLKPRSSFGFCNYDNSENVVLSWFSSHYERNVRLLLNDVFFTSELHEIKYYVFGH